MKILGRMNSRTVMMERFLDAEFSWHCCPQKTVTSVCVLYLLFTQPSLIRSFHSSDPCFSVSCSKGVGYARVYCITTVFVYLFIRLCFCGGLSYCYCLFPSLLLPSCIVLYLDETATVIFSAASLKMYGDDEKVFTSNFGSTANTITQPLQ